MSQQVTLPNTEVHLLDSKHVNQQFQIAVSLPAGYSPSGNYPVLYLTDSNINFPSMYTAVRFLVHNQSIPPLIVVGIGYPTEDISEVLRIRSREFLPTKVADIESGGAGKFVAFIQDELIPFVDTHYQTDKSNRALVGYSYGGTFGTYVLFNHQNMFNRYIIGAPALSWDNCICFDYEREYFEANSDLATRLYLGVGTRDEDLDSHIASLLFKFHATLKSRNYDNLKMDFDVYDGEDHLLGLWPFILNGVRTAFAD